MNRTLRLVALFASITLAACSGDTGTQTQNNETPDVGGGDVAVVPDSGGVDTGSPRDTGGGGNEDDVGGGQDAGDGGAVDPADSGSDVGSDAMADAEMDMGRETPDVGVFECAYPSTDPMCPAADFGPGSFLEFFQIETERNPGCCRDFDGDGAPDNFIGFTLIPLANTFGGIDVNQNIERAISLGRLVYLLELQNTTNEQYDSDVEVALLTGVDTDFDMSPNLAGTGEFYVSPESYDSSGDPFWGFASASIFDYELVATGGNLRVFFPGLVEAVDLWLTDVEMRGLITPGADLAGGGSLEVVDGEISGALMRDRFFQSMNDVANSCTCLGQDILQFNQAANRWDCTLQSTVCDQDPEESCQLVGDSQLCGTFALVSRQADLDTDGDGLKDAYSFGARFRGTTTTLKTTP